MNPPSALHGAMSRDRKPFTYTPGGLDLSEIKSERMAKRLMRNAMNQGVPETPVHPVHSQTNTSVPVKLPNFNCLPVQVFPTFNLPANPKSLLRTRSDPRETPIQRILPSTVNTTRFDNNDTFNNNNKYTPSYSQVNNNRPVSMYEYNAPPPAPMNTYSLPRANYGNDGYMAPELPEISYEAEYFRAPSKVYSASEQLPKLEISEEKDKLSFKESVNSSLDLTIKPLAEVTIPTIVPVPEVAKNVFVPTIVPDAVDKKDVNISNGQNVNISNGQNVNIPGPVETKSVNIPTIFPATIETEDVNISAILPPTAEIKDVNVSTILAAPVDTKDVYIPTFVPNPIETKDANTLNIIPTPLETKEETIPTIIPTSSLTDELKIAMISPTLDEPNEVTITPIPIVSNEEILNIPTISPTPVLTKPVEENAGTENEQREVKVVKKQVKKENKVEEQNGNQNGDANAEAEMTVKLPSKKSAAKTETKVEVVKKVLPDGSVEEVKTTTTKTTIDGRTEIKTKTETTIIPKEDESEEEVVEEEEEEGEVEEVQEDEPKTTTVTKSVSTPKENGQDSKIVKTEERSESSTTSTKKVVVVQDTPKEEQSVVEEEEEQEQEEEEVEEEVAEEAEPVTVVLKKVATPEPPVVESKQVEEEEEEEEEEVEEEPEEEKPVPKEAKKEVEPEEEEVEEEEVVEVKKEEVKAPPPKDDEEEEEEEEEYEEAEDKEESKVEGKTEVKETKEVEEEEEEEVEEEVKEEKQAAPEKPAEEAKKLPKEPEEKVIKVQIIPPEPKEEKSESAPQTEYKIPIREPSVPLEKVEDVEIKPIGSSPIISKTHTENTEIITSTIDPSGGLSRQTEYNKIENIVTVNRTTKILDHNYENLTQQGIPTVRTYFPPPSIDRISTSPMPSRPYQPVYPPEPTTERRHSLLLERLSTERQMPSDIYQYGTQNNQTFDQQYPGEPRAEVLTVSNVKPSSITSDQQWYQKTNQQNIIYNNVSSTPTPSGQPWAQPKSQPQPQQQYQPQSHYQAQHQPQQQYQPPTQQYQPSPTPQPQYQPSPTPQPQYQPSSTPQYSYSEPAAERAPSSYSTYTSTPTWASNTDSQQNTTQSNQYSSDSYLKTTQQYSSSYVPPPWEQDSSYTSVNNTSQKYYAPAPLPETQSFSPAPTAGWKPPPAKFTKNAPIAYIPPAPNQSFVRSASVSEPPRTPGRKTYYSEYERRYITVPESTYIPTETKYQPQPDPSPQYYYDNNEPSEEVEPQWRRELREFTEKTSQTTTTTTEQTSVQPPWEAEVKYPKNPSVQYTPTPTWSQTLRPRSFRERSFESEYASQEWPKTNTLGRGRPLSTAGKTMEAPIPERTRGVSVDRYNPVSYHSPVEQPPVQAHTLTTPLPHGGYHNPNVPAYHARASAEPREQPTSYQPRAYRESRASPLQSRSFKYLQWITGTEN